MRFSCRWYALMVMVQLWPEAVIKNQVDGGNQQRATTFHKLCNNRNDALIYILSINQYFNYISMQNWVAISISRRGLDFDSKFRHHHSRLNGSLAPVFHCRRFWSLIWSSERCFRKPKNRWMWWTCLMCVLRAKNQLANRRISLANTSKWTIL